MLLPIFITNNKDLVMMQNRWASIINPLLDNPYMQGILLNSISLNNGVTVVNHKLGRKLQGWVLVDIDGAAEVYRSAPKNDLTLTLTSNAAVTCDLYVF